MTAPRIALVTGGSRGIGRNAAVNIARRGVGVALTYHSDQTQAAAAVAEIRSFGGKAVALRLDTGNLASLDPFVAEFRQALKEHWGSETFDFLVNNAGVGLNTPIVDATEENFDLLMNIHLKGVFFLTQKLLSVMADGGRIINVTSGLARSSEAGYALYAMMKGGVEVFTRYLAYELGARGITANTVAPGPIATDFGGGAVRAAADHIGKVTALGRVGLPEDIGPMIASLLSEDNRWVNAQRIEVTGGMNI
ncbi:SDR family oxidoreductase [Methylopila sp. M107]|uniref:SDR family oxidoreductase n=1 Tax=Methylopila sp. M107 TaxID=1101190 RepID=UPI0003A28D6D|nr:SDR family oxidoreductase [Methylopila sp. M107]